VDTSELLLYASACIFWLEDLDILGYKALCSAEGLPKVSKKSTCIACPHSEWGNSLGALDTEE